MESMEGEKESRVKDILEATDRDVQAIKLARSIQGPHAPVTGEAYVSLL